ncbi:glycosyltransferase family 2 protein [Pseudomonas sp. TH15]|uniref:glycosyltransferase family 2 protein n=1 Tax=Pseudomonas sp. TH15 TaxID=2796381 RepID=UPI003144F262
MASRFTSGSQQSLAIFEEGKENRPSNQSVHVKILLCTFNGERFLAEQLDSIAAQTHENWSVTVSDDGSSDRTIDILREYKSRWGAEKLLIVDGPRAGFAQNFMSLVCDLEGRSDYYSWADQDDIWDAYKIERALECIGRTPADTPVLYCGRTNIVTENGEPVGQSPLFKRPPSFCNSLVQSLAGGNTMVFNHSAQKLLMSVGRKFPIVSHDWWAYLVITGVGGTVYYDKQPHLNYRQHAGNIVGANSSFFARLKRLKMIFSGRFYDWNQKNIFALETMQYSLTMNNQRVLESFQKARSGGVVTRVFYLKRSGVYRQTLLGGCALVFAVLCNAI